jgi:sigma-E factor negative regulatory protein RseB
LRSAGRLAGSLLGSLLLVLAPVWSARALGEDVNAWLERFSRGTGELSYRGVLTYERGDHLESLRITHGLVDGEEYERLEHLDGARREIIRRGQQLTCIHPGQRLIRLFQKRQLVRSGLEGLDAHYRLKLDGESRVAGRSAMMISVEPRDEYRFGYRLALDHDTGLLLRSELIGVDGQVLERFQFADVEIGVALRPEWISKPPADAAPQALAASAAVGAATGEEGLAWRPRWLPPGFTLLLAPRQPDEDVLTYSDGLAVLSVFLEPQPTPLPASEGRAHHGATNAYTKSLQGKDKIYTITAVGEVPQVTAAKVAASVGWREAQR